jgi:hypothetical protein
VNNGVNKKKNIVYINENNIFKTHYFYINSLIKRNTKNIQSSCFKKTQMEGQNYRIYLKYIFNNKYSICVKTSHTKPTGKSQKSQKLIFQWLINSNNLNIPKN